MAQPKIFVSYSRKDAKKQERLRTHLSILKDAADFDLWTDARIRPGEKWEPAIEQALSSASVAILLISADFLSSDFIRHKEVPAMLERREKEGLSLYPILAKACAWQAVPWIKETQLRPTSAKPVWRNGGRYADDELALITLELQPIIELAANVLEARDEAARQKAVQEKREKEKAIAEVIATIPAAEMFYVPTRADGTIEITLPRRRGYTLTDVFADQDLTRHRFSDGTKSRAGEYVDNWKILRDMQSKISDIMKDVRATQPATKNMGYKGWDEYLRS